MSTEKKLSTLIQSQLPNYILTEYPHFVEFVEAYYEWLEENRQAVSVVQNFPKDQDIDTASFGSLILSTGTGTGTFVVGETVYQGGTSISDALAKGTVFEIGTGYIEVTDVIGQFNTGFGPVVAIDSGASYNIVDINVIDSSLNNFVKWFKNEFIPTIPQEIISDPKNIIKNARQFYKAKGTQKSFRLLFRIMFNESVSFYYPWTDIIKPSDAKWIEPRTMKVRAFLGGSPAQFIGQQIRGRDSLTTALVEDVQVEIVNGIPIYELFLNRLSINGSFLFNELIESTNPAITAVAQLSTVISGVNITESGTGYSVGQVIEFSSSAGTNAQAQITAVGPNGEILNYRMNNFGAQYSIAEPVTVDFPSPYTTLAFGSAILDTLTSYPGFFLNDDGMPNATKYIRDGTFYQQHSYVIRASQSIDKYRSIVKELLHPAGLVFFGEFESVNTLDSRVRVGVRGRACAWIDIVRQTFLNPNEYPTLTEAQNPNLKVDNDISSNVDIVKIMQTQASSSALGPTVFSLNRSKRFHLPYEDFATKFPELDIQDGANAGYWDEFANYQLGGYGSKYTFEDYLKTPFKKVAIMPEPRHEISSPLFDVDDFVFEIETNPLEMTLPLTAFGSYNFVVDWGDGSSPDTITSWNQAEATHTYPASMTRYIIKISGTCTEFRFNNTGDKDKVRKVLNWGNVGFTTATAMFSGCSNLTIDNIPDTGAFSGVTIFSNMFNSCTSLTSVPLFDISSATNVSGMFFGCSALTTIPQFDFSSVTNANNLFYNCSSLDNVPALDLSSSLTIGAMFRGCTNLTTVGNITTTTVRTAYDMFRDCTSLVTAPNISDLTTLQYDALSQYLGTMDMFRGCSSLVSIPFYDISVDVLPDFYSTPIPDLAAFAAQTMFFGCSSLETGALNGMNVPVSYSNCNLSLSSIQDIFDGLATVPFKYTINVNGNSGSSSKQFFPNDATAVAKGWLVSPPSLIDFPAFDGPDAENWSLFEAAFADLKSQYTTFLPSTETITTSGSVAGTDKYRTSVLAPNGTIYSIPWNAQNVLRSTFQSSPTASIITSTTNLGTISTEKWYGAVVTDAGIIYGIPFDRNDVLKFDTNTNTFSFIAIASGSDKWQGGVLAPNGKIYFIPYSTSTVAVLDTADDSISYIGSLGFGAGKWSGGILAPNGMIYGIPSSSTAVLKIDPTTDTVSTFGSLSGTNKWEGGVLAPNGMIYGIPSNANNFLKIDPDTDTASTFGSLAVNSGKFSGGVLAPNGSIYCINSNHPVIVKIDPTTDTTTNLTNTGGNRTNPVLHPNGVILSAPRTSTSYHRLNTSSPVDPDFPLSKFYNRR